MRDQVLKVQQRIGAWCASRPTVRSGDDRGAVSTETAIITALVAVAAAGLAGFIATNIDGWQDRIPTP